MTNSAQFKIGQTVYVKPSEFGNDWHNGWGTITNCWGDDYEIEMHRHNSSMIFHRQRLSETAPEASPFSDPQPLG